MTGVSDPQVTIDVMGKRKTSKIARRNLSPYYDEVFYFNFPGLKKEEVMEGKILLKVEDCDLNISIPNFKDFALSHSLIGSYSVDMINVYKRKNHEMYRQWAVLFNSLEAEETGEQGRIKFSIVVLGPGDSQQMHDASKEDDEAVVEVEGESGEKALIGDEVEQKLNFLVFGVLRAEGLPGFNSLFGGVGLYCSLVLEFGGSIPATTSR